MDCSRPGFPVIHHRPEIAQNHVHQVGDAIQQSLLDPTISVPTFSSCLQSFPASGSFPVSQLITSGGQSNGSFSFSISPCNGYSGLISFMSQWFDLLAVQGTLKRLLQNHSLKTSALWLSAFFMVQLSHLYMSIGKTISLNRWTFVGSLLEMENLGL